MRFLPSLVTHCSRVWVDFLHFWDLKMRFFRDVKPTVQGTYLCMSSFSAFWCPENAISAESWYTWCNIWRVIKPTVHGYMASSSSFSAFWKPGNFYFWRVMKPTIQRKVLPCSSLNAFWRPEMLFLPRVKVVWALCRHFGDFRIRFLLSRNTKGFLHFVGLKLQILLGRDTHSFLWAFWRPEISIEADSWNPRLKDT